ncbi:uncharacterized protein METZ01_LOCUS312412, partial [marine metagenome]
VDKTDRGKELLQKSVWSAEVSGKIAWGSLKTLHGVNRAPFH